MKSTDHTAPVYAKTL